MKLAVFRTDASTAIGTGHVMRCLTLADNLRTCGYYAIFLCRQIQGNIGEYIKKRGYAVEWLDSKNDVFCQREDVVATRAIIEQMTHDIIWLIVDHYGIDYRWEAEIGSFARHVLVIDDLADRRHQCDIIVDQNVYEEMETRYNAFVPEQCLRLFGPQYLLMRPSFYKTRQSLRVRDGVMRRLLVFFGGSDPTCETVKAIHALAACARRGWDIRADIVIGEANRRTQEIVQICGELACATLHIQTEKMAELIAESDFALGAGGVAMWERCYLGLPSAITVVADNQEASVRYGDGAGAVRYLGKGETTNEKAYIDAIIYASQRPVELQLMSERAFILTESRPDRRENPIVPAMLAMENY